MCNHGGLVDGSRLGQLSGGRLQTTPIARGVPRTAGTPPSRQPPYARCGSLLYEGFNRSSTALNGIYVQTDLLIGGHPSFLNKVNQHYLYQCTTGHKRWWIGNKTDEDQARLFKGTNCAPCACGRGSVSRMSTRVHSLI